MKIRTKLAGIFFGVSALFVVALLISLFELHAQSQGSKKLINEDVAAMSGLQELYAQGLQGGQATRNVLLDPADQKAAENYKKSVETFSKAFADTSKYFAKTDQKGTAEELGKTWQEDSQLRDQVIQMAVSGKVDDAKKLLTEKETAQWRALKELLFKLETRQKKELAKRISSFEIQSRNAQIITVIISVLAIAFSVFAIFSISRIIADPLAAASAAAEKIAAGDLTVMVPALSKDEIGALADSINNMAVNLKEIISHISESSTSVATASLQLKTNSERIADGSRQIEDQTISLGTASEEMAATSADIARNCHMAASNSAKASDDAKSGVTAVQKTIEDMEMIAGRVRSSAQTVSSLGQRSEQIGAIVGTIEDIADQTNLLALNAAIEAARAGEQGRGFAVVADEVRALAERTTRATHEISDMIRTIQSETNSAVNTMEAGVQEVQRGMETTRHSEEVLQRILASVDEVAIQIDQIATAAEEQTATTHEIATNIHSVTNAIDNTAHYSRDNVDAVSKLALLAEDLLQRVCGFKVS